MIPESISEFILRRRSELMGEAEPLRERLRAVENELRELKVAEDAIKRGPPPVLPLSLLFNSDPSHFMRAPRGAIKNAILRTLERHPAGLDAITILHEMNSRDGTSYERTSLSPQLSRLKADGYVTLEGNTWRIIPASRLLKNADPGDDEPVDESGHEGSTSLDGEDGNPGAGGAGAF